MQLDKNKLKLIMARKQITMEDLAKAYGTTRSGLYSTLKSLNKAPQTIGRLASALGVDPLEIIVQEE